MQQADDLVDAEVPAQVGTACAVVIAQVLPNLPEMQVSSTADAEPASSSDHGATLSADQPTASPSKGIQFNPVK